MKTNLNLEKLIIQETNKTIKSNEFRVVKILLQYLIASNYRCSIIATYFVQINRLSFERNIRSTKRDFRNAILRLRFEQR